MLGGLHTLKLSGCPRITDISISMLGKVCELIGRVVKIDDILFNYY